MHISELWIYPIKSLPGIRLESARADIRGFEFDRTWMLTDENDRFITIRERKDLYDFQVELTDNHIIIDHKYAGDCLRIPVDGETSDPRCVTIWDDQVEAYGFSREADNWFSGILGTHVRLVTFGKTSVRPINPTWRTGGEEVSFADGYPYLIVGRKSLEDISTHSGAQMDVRRFRPNIVVDGGKAYDEYYWDRLQMGEAELLGLKPCERCVVTTIDPDTQAGGKEPLRALAGMHVEKRALFGQHASLIKGGVITVGDEVRVLQRKAALYAPL